MSLNPAGEPIRNYWGYSTVGFFSPHSGYCVRPRRRRRTLNEFRDLVKALHKAGIEVILDVVFNHTDEGNELGPTYSFRGIDNRTFYLLDPNNPARLSELQRRRQHVQRQSSRCRRNSSSTACGTGWRRCTSTDSGSTKDRFSRAGEDGAPLVHPPVIWQIELDDALADTKVIAEAWDAAGLYQVGHFPAIDGPSGTAAIATTSGGS